MLLFAALFACARTVPPSSTAATDATDATDATTSPSTVPAPRPELWISGYFSNAVARVDAETHAVVAVLDDVAGAQAILPWRGGALVVAENAGEILFFDAAGGRSVWLSGLVAPTGIALLPDGTFAVGSYAESRVLRFDAEGAPLGELAAGLAGADAGLAVDADGRLWVPCYDGNEVVVLEGSTDVLHIPVARPRTIRFDADGTAWVTSWSMGAIRRFDASGADVGTFATRDGATGLAFDGADGVWIASDQAGAVEHFAVETAEVFEEIDPELKGITFVQPVALGG